MLRRTDGFCPAALCFLLCWLWPPTARADSWRDPSWKWMLDSSDVVALVEYGSGGKFMAEARILRTYKGSLSEGEEIWITGFSNRFGPIDRVRRGERFVVFLSGYGNYGGDFSSWEERAAQGEVKRGFVEALKAGKAYWVSSPTSGDLKVKGNNVQYSFIQTSWYSGLEFYSLSEFEGFLAAYYHGKDTGAFAATLMELLRKDKPCKRHAQALLMLGLLQHDALDPSFDRFIDASVPDVRYALARYAGGVSDDHREEILLALMKDEHSMVQGEAVRQLGKLPADRVGPALLAQLPSANAANYGPSNIMDPVMNTVNGGRAEIILTLGRLHYEPAIPVLLRLLESNDERTFDLVAEALREMGSRAHVPYINAYFLSGRRELIHDMFSVINHDSLYECVPAMMRYVHDHDRTIHPDQSFLVSWWGGLGQFPSDTTIAFLRSDLIYLVDSLPSNAVAFTDPIPKWIVEYMQTFEQLGISDNKEVFYRGMFDYYGFDDRFRADTTLFALKAHLEDSIAHVVRAAFPDISRVDVSVLLGAVDGPRQAIADYTVDFEVANWREQKDLVIRFEGMGIAKSHLLPRERSSTYALGARRPAKFRDYLMHWFLHYLKAFPEEKDLAVLRNLGANGYAVTDEDRSRLEETMTAINSALSD